MSHPGETISTALAEASVESLTDLMSRDPEGFQTQDRSRIIQVLREQRERFAKTETETAGSRGRGRGGSTLAEALVKKAHSTAGDLGL